MSCKQYTRAVALTFAAISAAPTPIAHASPLLDLVGDPSGPGGLQARTVSGGAGSAYFNPALLIDTPAQLTLGVSLLTERIGIALQGRPGTEFAVPDGLVNARHADTSRFDSYPIATNLLQYGRMKDALHDAFIAHPRQAAGTGHDTLSYEVVGLVVKFFDDRVALGFHGMIPNRDFTQLHAFFNDEREQYFSNSLHPELYSDRMTSISLALGMGIRVTDQLSLGIGATLSLKASVLAPTYVVDTGDLGKILIDLDGGVKLGVAPHFGVHYKVSERLRLTATAHSPQRVEFGVNFTFLLPNGVQQASGITFVLDYTPWQLALGGAYDLIQQEDQSLTLVANLLYAAWSSYIDRHDQQPSDAYAWANTLSPTLGVRYTIGKLTSGFDVAYTPTPVPEQTGRSNYVDNDRIGGSLGTAYTFNVFHTAVKVGAQVQFNRLLERRQTKLPTPTSPDGAVIAPERVKDEIPDDARISGDPVVSAQGLQTNNPGWPGFASRGWLLGATLYLSLAL